MVNQFPIPREDAKKKRGQEISCPLDRGSFFSTSRGREEIDDRQLPNFTARPLAPLPVGGCGVIAEAACEHVQLALPSWLRCSPLPRQGQHSRCRLRCVWASLEGRAARLCLSGGPGQ
jgi:hypothetical protein